MTDEEREQIRLTIRGKLERGELPRYPIAHGAARLSGGAAPREFMTVGLLTNPCSACGRSGDHGILYTGEAGTFRFHQECHHLWIEASRPPLISPPK
jgi:hypothetical protein